MRQPAYHLRPNKAVDRLVFIEAINILGRSVDLSKYTYYGFGGPYLEEFRILYEAWPRMRLVSIEEKEETYKRQRFHLPCKTLTLKLGRFASFLAQYEPRDTRSIFWLDNTGLEYQAFLELALLLGKVADQSVIKITLRAEASDYEAPKLEERLRRVEGFRKEFGRVLPTSSVDVPTTLESFASLLQEMVAVASQNALQGLDRTYQPLSSFCYADGAGIFTFTGIVCPIQEIGSTLRPFSKWPFANLDWSPPKRIDLPYLSTKERLHLQGSLPRGGNAGGVLRRTLGYLIDPDDKEKSEADLQQYAEFHRHFPFFVKAVP